MKKRIPGVIALIAVGSVLLAGCSASSDSSAAAGQGDGIGEVNFVATDDPSTYTAVIKAFEAANPNIAVTYTQIPFAQYNSTLQQRLGAKDDTIDVYGVDQPRMAQLAAQGFLEDLSDLKDQTKSAVSDAQYEVSVYQDKLWALPISNSAQMLFYNKKALDSAGVAHPSIDPAQRLTWEQIETEGKAAQAAGTKYGLLLEQPNAYYQLQPLMESAGGGSGFTGDDNLTADVANDGWNKAMSWYSETFDSKLSPRGIGDFQTSPVFAAGDLAFFVGGSWDLGTFADSGVDWGIAPMPSFKGGGTNTPTGSWSWGLNSASKNKAAALTFMKFAALDTDGSLATSGTTSNIPSNLAAQAKYLQQLDTIAGDHSAGASKLIAYEIKNTATPRPVSVGYPQFEDAANKAFGDILNGSPVKDRLAQAQKEITDAWAQLK
ncbi:sugar ABC transporter substrate-binding protein [Streptosporangium sp. 'caverna']|uniref:sugar ABC transporter substrate-binding protein n=1 Tax=Streptosporangium sp. 'caverna' TaxID=2202249 RepID=UPI0013A6DAB4|nr:sugar ABC transporter substrate-binding protein [Streptosporangium sp. 'caverna']